MKIADGVYMLEVKGGFGAIYPTLLSAGDKLVLIDAGFPGMFPEISQTITEAGFKVEDLTDIILTHQDIDHIGCVKELLAAAPSAQVWIFKDEAPYVDGTKTPIKLAAMLEQYDQLPDDRKAWCDQLKEGFEGRQISGMKTVSDNQVLPFCGGVEVVHTPGHTPGHMCLFLQGSGVMVCGDAANITEGGLVGSNPQHTWDTDLAQKSLERILGYKPSAVVCYHTGYQEM